MTGYEAVGFTKFRRCGCCELVEEGRYSTVQYSNSHKYIHDEEQRDKMQRGSLDEPSQKRPRAPTTGSRDPFILIYSIIWPLFPQLTLSLLREGQLPH
jgi:hypothetical protein